MRTVGGGGGWDLRSKSEGMIGTNKFLDGANDFCNMAVSSTSPGTRVILRIC